MFTLCEKVFSREPVKSFSTYGSNYSGSLVFGNAAFGDIKDHSLRMRSFEKIFTMDVLDMCLSYGKKVFSGAPVKCFSHYGSNNLGFC